MYRHEAISIARQVMDRARITTELQPWVVDAILAAVNGTVVAPVEPTYKQMVDALPLTSTEDIVAGDRLPTPENWSVVTGERVPVAWRRPIASYIYHESAEKPEHASDDWQPLYAE